MTTKQTGDAAEVRAIAHLQANGYRILRRNYKVRGGEVDVIAQDGPTLCFVEVRSRRSTTFGRAEETVSPAKQRRIILAARHWLAGHPTKGACRFDVVSLNGDGAGGEEVTLFRDAFRVP
jgi:putative endonuclease